jgi:hypothetical protein
MVSVHWGPMMVDYPYLEQYRLVHRLVDVEASTVIMHHAHVQQGVEIVSGSPICYNLGNCIFDPDVGISQQASNFTRLRYEEQMTGAMFCFTWRGKSFANLRVVPYGLPPPDATGRPHPGLGWLTNGKAEAAMARLARISDDLAGDFSPKLAEQLWALRRREIAVNLDLIFRQGQFRRISTR